MPRYRHSFQTRRASFEPSPHKCQHKKCSFIYWSAYSYRKSNWPCRNLWGCNSRWTYMRSPVQVCGSTAKDLSSCQSAFWDTTSRPSRFRPHSPFSSGTSSCSKRHFQVRYDFERNVEFWWLYERVFCFTIGCSTLGQLNSALEHHPLYCELLQVWFVYSYIFLNNRESMMSKMILNFPNVLLFNPIRAPFFFENSYMNVFERFV